MRTYDYRCESVYVSLVRVAQVLCCAGHNCFGAVLYPITMADFTIADVTDAMLDGTSLADQLVLFRCRFVRHSGYIAGFPNTYAEKVGKTSDALYKGVAPTLHETALGLDVFLVLQLVSRHT